MISAIQKQQDGTIQLTITIPASEVEKVRKEVVAEMVKATELPGFRKGKAPQKLVEEKLDKEKIKEEVLKKVLPKFYTQAVTEHKLKPILNPKIHVQKLEDGKDWQFIALTCEAPVVKLDSYKENIQKITTKSKIIVPGQEKQEPKLEDVVKALLESVSAQIPAILIAQEAERLLAQLLDDIKRLGLTLDQYLASTQRTPEALRAEYEKKVEGDLKLEFTLQRIAEEEKITVSDKEIEEAILKAKDENERKNLEQNKYLLASILRQQKTLDFIKNL